MCMCWLGWKESAGWEENTSRTIRRGAKCMRNNRCYLLDVIVGEAREDGGFQFVGSQRVKLDA